MTVPAVVIEARALMRASRMAALATAMANESGWPFASLVTVAWDWDAAPLLLLSDLAEHSRSLKADPRAALLIEAAKHFANPQAGPRLTLIGRIAPAAEARQRQRFLTHHPHARRYASFADFRCYRMSVERVLYVAGFARATWIDGRNLMLVEGSKLAASEAYLVDEINRRLVDDVRLCAHRLLGKRGHHWRVAALDPEGLDLRCRTSFARLAFADLAIDAEACRRQLGQLAALARRDDSLSLP